MSNHLSLAHAYWREVIKPGETAIDATCGNGHDSYFLSTLGAHVISYDIQPKAIEATRLKVPHATFHLSSHATFFENAASLVVYNLGYLPGGDKGLTTRCDSTLQSVENALAIAPALSITCYPGHPEGAKEEAFLLAYLRTLDPKKWDVCFHQWPNRRAAPSLLWILQKKI